MTEASSLDIDAMQAWRGRVDEADDVVTPGLAARFGALFDDPSRDWRVGDAVPPGLHWCLAPLTVPTAALGSDGHPARGGFMPPIPLPRRQWAGGLIEQRSPLRVGDVVRRSSRIDDIAVKTGRTGALCFVTIGHVFRIGGVVAVRERQDLVFRGAEAGGPPPVAAPAEPARWSATVVPHAPLLFRYAALTFNSHRIHYDRRYAVEQEGYPGLVVQGTLQATLLLRFAAACRGDLPPATLAFRSVASLYDGPPFTLNAREEASGGLRLWTADGAGRRAMVADAAW